MDLLDDLRRYSCDDGPRRDVLCDHRSGGHYRPFSDGDPSHHRDVGPDPYVVSDPYRLADGVASLLRVLNMVYGGQCDAVSYEDVVPQIYASLVLSMRMEW